MESQEASLSRIDERTEAMLKAMEDHKVTHQKIDDTIRAHGEALAAQSSTLKAVAWFAAIPLTALAVAGATWIVGKF